MDVLESFNAAIGYLEENLDGEIDYARAARAACCSLCHFQRMFSFAAGVTLSEYVRRRRLTRAALDLQRGDERVLDVALRYGYDSPTAFTRAFRAMHGVSPREAKNPGVGLKSYPRISFHLSVKGEQEMKYRMEKKEAFRLVGYKKEVSTVGGQNHALIPQFWDEVCADGRYARVAALADGGQPGPSGVLGVCANFRDGSFDYFVAAATGGTASDGMEAFEVPALQWAVFESIGPMPDAIQDVWKRIYTEWFPQSGYEHAGGPELEWYGMGDMQSDDYLSEVWIPVVKNG